MQPQFSFFPILRWFHTISVYCWCLNLTQIREGYTFCFCLASLTRSLEYLLIRSPKKCSKPHSSFCLVYIIQCRYLIGQNFQRTKQFVGQNFRHQADFCIEILDKILGGENFSLDKIFDTKSKFRQSCPTFA